MADVGATARGMPLSAIAGSDAGRRCVSTVEAFRVLAVHANRAVSSDVLIDASRGSERSGADKLLRMAIARLRKALEPVNGTGEPVVRTVGGGEVTSS